MPKNLNKDKVDQSIVLIANTSKYLIHYRFLLIKKLNASYKKLFVVAPIDKSTNELNDIVCHQPWHLSSENEFNFFELIKSFFLLFNSIRSISPNLVHSHTLKPNLLISIVNSFFGIKTILSFPGMGRLSTSKGLKYIFFKFILKFIYLTSIYQLDNFIFFKRNFNRVKFIFQNPIDLDFFIKTVKVKYDHKTFNLIPGSGVPSKYFKSIKNYTNEIKNNIDFIYCARLEKSKGINLFIALSEYYPDSKFFIYGSLDKNSKNCLTYEEIINFKRKNKNLIFMDYVKDPLLLHHNDNTIFLVPSNYGEGLPRGILESISLEIPVVASKKACVGLFDNRTIFMVSNNQIESYVDVIEEIITKKNEGKLNKFLSKSKQHVKQNYEEYFIVEKTLDLYKSFD